MTAFIQASNGDLLHVGGIKLHIGQGHNADGVYAGTALVGTVAKGGCVQTLMENLAIRASSTHGVFGIRDGAIYRRHITGEASPQISNYGTGENLAWGSGA